MTAPPHLPSSRPCPVCETATAQPFMQVAGRHYWRCPQCQATFLDPSQRPTAKREQAEYRLHDNNAAQAGYRRFLQQVAQPLLQRLPPGQHGLDYGCGPGPVLAALLREAGHTVALYDPFFVPDRTVLDTRYDFITCTEVAEHFHSPAAEFRRLDSLLKPGGWLAQLGARDIAGGSVVHINAGVAGLVCAYVLGPRRGYGREAFTPFNLGLTMAGAGMLWVGWFGFNAGSAGAADYNPCPGAQSPGPSSSKKISPAGPPGGGVDFLPQEDPVGSCRT